MSGKTELIVALNYTDKNAANLLIEKLRGLPVIYKIGMDLFGVAGPAYVRTLTEKNVRVFLDLKFHDIPSVVAKTGAMVAGMGVEMFTIHLMGGRNMCELTVQAVEKLKLKKPTRVLGVSVLTSHDQPSWSELTKDLAGSPAEIQDSVQRLLARARQFGLTGVVCSAHELIEIGSTDPEMFTVVPGIRPEGAEVGDQARVMTPAKAAACGARAIVMGRPIYEAENPREVCESVLKDLS